jgi:hypothetical protein
MVYKITAIIAITANTIKAINVERFIVYLINLYHKSKYINLSDLTVSIIQATNPIRAPVNMAKSKFNIFHEFLNGYSENVY